MGTHWNFVENGFAQRLAQCQAFLNATTVTIIIIFRASDTLEASCCPDSSWRYASHPSNLPPAPDPCYATEASPGKGWFLNYRENTALFLKHLRWRDWPLWEMCHGVWRSPTFCCPFMSASQSRHKSFLSHQWKPVSPLIASIACSWRGFSRKFN